MHNSYRNVQINSSMATYILAPSCTNICIYIFLIYKYALKVGAYCKYICMYIRNPNTNCNTYVLVCMRNFQQYKRICTSPELVQAYLLFRYKSLYIVSKMITQCQVWQSLTHFRNSPISLTVKLRANAFTRKLRSVVIITNSVCIKYLPSAKSFRIVMKPNETILFFFF